ncbi:HTH-type transcriptional regulator ArgP [Halomonas sp. NPDC076908]|uniref:HTH-type transcriptional regulator ArgP n=1 Tax=Halomonas sp. NPDC076908 TaxID=3390567 RepID=UPI003D03E734
MFDPKKKMALIEVVASGSFERAARKLNITTSAVSQRVRALEVEMGMSLLIRDRPCRPTEEGKKLIRHLKNIEYLNNEFMNEFIDVKKNKLRFSIAVNNDSLSNWLMPVLAEYLQSGEVMLDVYIDDQDYTHLALESGLTIMAVTSKEKTFNSCKSVCLGKLRYKLACSSTFYKKWFKNGVNFTSLKNSPLLVFCEKDRLQEDFLKNNFGLMQDICSCHYIPSSEAYYEAVLFGIGYGMMPLPKYEEKIISADLIDLMPTEKTDISLYLHYWETQLPKLVKFREQIIAQARKVLVE